MKNPFDKLSKLSVDKPKTVIAFSIIGIIALSSFARFIIFDNSEDAFYPTNDTTDLLYEVEDTYTVDVDLIRAIVRFESGDLQDEETWRMLAGIEADMLDDPQMSQYHYELFGGNPNAGPASSAIFWQQIQDPVSDDWSSGIENALTVVIEAEDENLSVAVSNAMVALSSIPSTDFPNASTLDEWNPTNSDDWQSRMDQGLNNSENIDGLIDLVADLNINRTPEQYFTIAPLIGGAMTALAPLDALQDVDFRSTMMSMFPAESRDSPWVKADTALVTLAIGNPSADDVELEGDELPLVSEMTLDLEDDLQNSYSSTISVFSFARFEAEQAGNVGAEIGMLTSASILVLGIILWRQFRSVRDTGIVILLTLLAIAATYGVSGILKLEFNAAMNSIPILLLAIGVDYGLHVVLRYREELIKSDSSKEKESMAEFSSDVRARAIKTGTILTSAALSVAIITDMVGFLSFRLSSQNFLVVFGTVIAVGLFFIYLLSISILPALLTILPPQKIPLAKSVQVKESRFSIWTGEQTLNPLTVIIAAILISLPVAAGINQLEIGFDYRDQLNEEIPVVADFLVLSDDFAGQNQPPLYVVIDGEVFSDDGRESYLNAMSVLENDSSISEQTGIWEILELQSTRDSELRGIMESLNSSNPNWFGLTTWVDKNQDLTFRYLREDNNQTVISFQAPTLDWQKTVDFVTDLDSSLNENGEYRVSGRGLVLAQVSEDVAKSAVASTLIVAGIILFMLLAINVSREASLSKGVLKGVVMWFPLVMVVIWVYGIMGWLGYQLNSQTVTIGALTLGLGVDYAVHFVTRVDEEIEANPSAGVVNWVSTTNATTGRAMMAAAFTTAGGFAVLNLSSLLPLRLFGQVFVVAILLALISSIILLPVMLSFFGLIPKSTADSEE